jgi:predicted DNA binding CopG/RHH family protein
MPTEIRIEEETIAQVPSAAAQDLSAAESQDFTSEEAASSDELESGEAKKSKKLISLRVAQEDLAQAKALAEDLKVGYQTLLLEIIHDGLVHRAAQQRLVKLAENIRGTVPGLSAEQLANAPVVKAAQDLLNTPAVKSAQELVSSPVIKLAQDLAANPQVKAAQEFANTTAKKAEADLNKAAADFTALPAVQAVQATSAKLLSDLTASSAFKAAEDLVAKVKSGHKPAVEGAEAPVAEKTGSAISTEEFLQLANAVEEIKRALKNNGMF